MSTARRWEIDALRGLMLVLMTVTHLPTRWASPLSQPFGYVSAAEGFVLLSAYMVGLVYAQKRRRVGEAGMKKALLDRAWKIYLCQAALLVFLFSIVAAIGVTRHQPAVTDMLNFYFEQPLTAFVSGMLLVYNPPLLDILPLYIFFLVLSPLVMVHDTERGWCVILGISLALWFGAQFGLGPFLYRTLVTSFGVKVPVSDTGAFGALAWQLLWVIGLWMGSRQAAAQPIAGRFPPWMVAVAVAYALACLIARHAMGQLPAADASTLGALFDKWDLGSLRLINLLALIVVVMHFGPRWIARLNGVPALELLGQASLPVFCAHLVATLLALAIIGAAVPERPIWVDGALMGLTFAALYAVAWVSRWPSRRRASSARARPA